MNLLLLHPSDLQTNHCAILTDDDRRTQHMRQVHNTRIGDTLKVGLLNGLLGEGSITEINSQCIKLDVQWHSDAPSPLPTILLLALPRPKMLKRTVQAITALGVKQLILINSYRVEKSYWSTPLLQTEALQEQMILGLEQACDTQMPTITLAKRFKPFVEDELPSLLQNRTGYVAHPKSPQKCPIDIKQDSIVAVGPEGGFIPYEVEKLIEAGFQGVNLGPRIQRVETFVPNVLGRLYPG